MALTRSEDSKQKLAQYEEEEELKATLLEHLGELRVRIIRSLIFVSIGWIAGYNLFWPIYRVLLRPLILQLNQLPKDKVKVVMSGFSEGFLMQVKVGLFIGLIFAAPMVVMQLWGFIAPGLTKKERRGIRFVAPLSVALFVIGVGFGYAILPSAIHWFLKYLPPETSLYQDPQTYILFVVKMLFAFGLAFQLPIVILFLAKINLVTTEMLWKNWRQAVVIISVAAMVLTPSNDAVTMLAMGIPMVILYFLSIGLVGYVNRIGEKENERERQQAL